MPVMTRAERDEFLREPGVLMRVAAVRPDGSPLVTPIWFLFEDDSIYFTPREQSEWFRVLEARSEGCALHRRAAVAVSQGRH